VRRLAQMGARVLIADVSDEWGEAPARQVGAGSLYVPTDCMDEDAIAKAVKATIDDDATAADAALARLGTNYQLCFNFLDHTGLSL
jgi:NAD(P)-dependent dehydrogenase (short-subunit alcohol dehydrogenase family)